MFLALALALAGCSRPCPRWMLTPTPSLDAHAHALAGCSCPRPRPCPRWMPMPTPDLVLGDTCTGYPHTCACIPTCWVTTCMHTRWGVCICVGRHAYVLGGMCMCWEAHICVGGVCIHVGARVYALGACIRVGGCAFVFRGVHTLWEVCVHVGGVCVCVGGAHVRVGVCVRVVGCAYVLGGVHSCSGGCVCVGGHVHVLGACAHGCTHCLVVTKSVIMYCNRCHSTIIRVFYPEFEILNYCSRLACFSFITNKARNKPTQA
jgi:hypothetical protein